MKKITAIILGTLVATSAVFAQSNVLSRNAVGYIKVPLASNSLYLVSNPFVPLDPSADIATNVFAALPNSASVSIWDEVSQGYVSISKNARGLWSANGTTRISRADAMFVRMPGTTSTLYFMGEVPDRFTAPTTTQSRAAGISMLGYPYPVETAFTGTPMAINLPLSSSISVWDSAANTYISYSKNARGLWNAEALTATVKPGQGFVIRTTGAGSWNTAKSYTWP